MAHRDQPGVRGQILERQRLERPEHEHREHAHGTEPDPSRARRRTANGARRSALGRRGRGFANLYLDHLAQGFGQMRPHDPGRAPYGASSGRPPVCGSFTGLIFAGFVRCGITGTRIGRGGRSASWIARFRRGAVRNYAMSRAYLCVSVAAVSDGKGRRGPSAPLVRGHHGRGRRGGSSLSSRDSAPSRPYLLAPDVLRRPRPASMHLADVAPRVELGTHLDHERGRASERAGGPHGADGPLHPGVRPPAAVVPRGAGRSRPGALGILESLGYAVESSVDAVRARTPRRPTQPYRPDPSEPGRPGSRDLLEVPVTTRRLACAPSGARTVDRSSRAAADKGTAEGLVRVAEDEIASARRAAPDAARHPQRRPRERRRGVGREPVSQRTRSRRDASSIGCALFSSLLAAQGSRSSVSPTYRRSFVNERACGVSERRRSGSRTCRRRSRW